MHEITVRLRAERRAESLQKYLMYCSIQMIKLAPFWLFWHSGIELCPHNYNRSTTRTYRGRILTSLEMREPGSALEVSHKEQKNKICV
jgi:hypothetical protein